MRERARERENRQREFVWLCSCVHVCVRERGMKNEKESARKRIDRERIDRENREIPILSVYYTQF